MVRNPTNRPETIRKRITTTAITEDKAEPKLQLLAAKNWAAMTFEYMIPEVPPSSAGVTKAPNVSRNTMIEPDRTPGLLNGKVTRVNAFHREAPRSRAASYSAGSMRSTARKIGSTMNNRYT